VAGRNTGPLVAVGHASGAPVALMLAPRGRYRGRPSPARPADPASRGERENFARGAVMVLTERCKIGR